MIGRLLNGFASGFRAFLHTAVAPYILSGLFLRLVVMPFTVHGDMVLMYWQAAETVASGHFDLYDYSYQMHGAEVFSPLIWSPYGPVFYVVAGGWLSLLRLAGLHPIFPWTTFGGLMLLPRAAFLIKLLYLLVEAGLVWLLCRTNKDGRPDERVVALWMLNPNVLYSTYIMGQNDILPITCIVVSLWAGVRSLRGEPYAGRWAALAAAVLGLGGAMKMFPLACLPIAVLLLARTSWARVRLLCIGLLPFVLCIGPYLPSRAFRYSSLLNHEAMGVMGLTIIWPNAMPVPIAVVAYVMLLVAVWFVADTPRLNVLAIGYFAALTILYVFGPPLPQWYIWTAPFLALFAAGLPRIWILLALQTLFFAFRIASGWDNISLGLGLFKSVLGQWFERIPSLSVLFDDVFPFERIFAASFAVYIAALICIGFLLWRERRALFTRSEGPWLHPFLLIVPLLVLCGVLVGHLLLGQGRIAVVQSDRGGAAVPVAGNRVEQTFIAPVQATPPTLRCIDLRLRDIGRYNMAPLRLAVMSDNVSTPLATAEATPSGDDEQWQSFCFSSLTLVPNQLYRFAVTTEDANNSIVVVSSKEDGEGYPQGGLLVNGAADPGGADLNFKLRVALPWGEVGQTLRQRVQEDPTFFAVYVLLLIMCIGSFTVAVVQQWRRSPRLVLIQNAQ